MAPRTVLIVDDNRGTRDIFRVALEAAGYRVFEAASGTEALRKVGWANPDLILLDLMMPPPDGLDVGAALAADPALRSIPIVLLSAHPQGADASRVGSANFIGFLRKPIGVRELVNAVRDYIGPPEGDAES